MSGDISTLEITGKTIVVTGGGSGIGKGIVKALHSSKNKLYVLERNEDSLKSLEADCPGIIPICVDISDWDKVEEVLENKLPAVVDGLVNNAGVGGDPLGMWATEEDVDKVLSVNLRGMLKVSQVVVKRMLAKKVGEDEIAGSIVNVSSLASRYPTRISVSYNISKAGVDMLTKSMAFELGPLNIRVNSVNPGIVLGTDLSAAWIAAGGGDQLKEKLLARTPIGRIVQVDDIVKAVLFLLNGERTPMICGESLFVEGGYSIS